MKKKLLSIMLVVIMCIANVMPVFALSEVDPVDPTVQKYIDAYRDLEAVFTSETKDLEALKAAVAASEGIELDMDQSEEFLEYVDFEDWFLCNVGATNVIEADKYNTAFTNSKSGKTAKDLVEFYEMIISEEYADYGLKETISAWIPGFEAAYEEAKTMLPSENVAAFYDAFTEVQTQLEGTVDSLREAVEACNVDLFNEFTDEEKEEFVALMGFTDWEEAFNVVLSDWIDANLVLEVDDAYNAYTGSWSVKDAKAFVEKMNQVNEMYGEDLSLFEYFFGDLNSVYEEAKELIANGGNEEDTETKEEVTEPEDRTEKAAKTGDVAPVIPMVVLFAGAAIVLVAQKKRIV